MLDGWKTYAASFMMFGLAVKQFVSGDFVSGWQTISAALAIFGIRHAMSRKGM